MSKHHVARTEFGTLSSGRPATLFSLTNSSGLRADVTDYGATLCSIFTPDRQGALGDVVLGFEHLRGYLAANAYMGATVGRYANRIAEGKFELQGQQYKLDKNNPPNHLHGGNTGFDKRLWHAEILAADHAAVRFSLFSPDGDQHFPGNLMTYLVYRLRDDNSLSIHVEASTDKSCPVSITHHAYFNLAGRGSVLDHELQLSANTYTPIDKNLIPTGELRAVDASAFDFRESKRLGSDIDAHDEQLHYAHGYDHNFVTGATRGGPLVSAACLYDPGSGREMTLETNAPGLQVYSANFLNGSTSGKGVEHHARHAVCLEPQQFPDAPNKPAFPNSVVHPGEKFKQETVLRFGVR